MKRVTFDLSDDKKEWLAKVLDLARLEYKEAFTGVVDRWIAMTDEDLRSELLAIGVLGMKATIEEKRVQISALKDRMAEARADR